MPEEPNIPAVKIPIPQFEGEVPTLLNESSIWDKVKEMAIPPAVSAVINGVFVAATMSSGVFKAPEVVQKVEERDPVAELLAKFKQEKQHKEQVITAIEAQRSTQVDLNIDQYFDPSSRNYLGDKRTGLVPIPTLDKFFEFDAYNRVLRSAKNRSGKLKEKTLGKEVAAYRDRQTANAYGRLDQIIDSGKYDWTCDVATDAPTYQHAMFLAPEGRFFQSPFFDQMQYKSGLAEMDQQISMGAGNCTLSQWTPSNYDYIYQRVCGGDSRMLLEGLGVSVWFDHVDSALNTNSGFFLFREAEKDKRKIIYPGLQANRDNPARYMPPEFHLAYYMTHNGANKEQIDRMIALGALPQDTLPSGLSAGPGFSPFVKESGDGSGAGVAANECPSSGLSSQELVVKVTYERDSGGWSPERSSSSNARQIAYQRMLPGLELHVGGFSSLPVWVNDPGVLRYLTEPELLRRINAGKLSYLEPLSLVYAGGSDPRGDLAQEFKEKRAKKQLLRLKSKYSFYRVETFEDIGHSGEEGIKLLTEQEGLDLDSLLGLYSDIEKLYNLTKHLDHSNGYKMLEQLEVYRDLLEAKKENGSQDPKLEITLAKVRAEIEMLNKATPPMNFLLKETSGSFKSDPFENISDEQLIRGITNTNMNYLDNIGMDMRKLKILMSRLRRIEGTDELRFQFLTSLFAKDGKLPFHNIRKIGGFIQDECASGSSYCDRYIELVDTTIDDWYAGNDKWYSGDRERHDYEWFRLVNNSIKYAEKYPLFRSKLLKHVEELCGDFGSRPFLVRFEKGKTKPVCEELPEDFTLETLIELYSKSRREIVRLTSPEMKSKLVRAYKNETDQERRLRILSMAIRFVEYGESLIKKGDLYPEDLLLIQAMPWDPKLGLDIDYGDYSRIKTYQLKTAYDHQSLSYADWEKMQDYDSVGNAIWAHSKETVVRLEAERLELELIDLPK